MSDQRRQPAHGVPATGWAAHGVPVKPLRNRGAVHRESSEGKRATKVGVAPSVSKMDHTHLAVVFDLKDGMPSYEGVVEAMEKAKNGRVGEVASSKQTSDRSRRQSKGKRDADQSVVSMLGPCYMEGEDSDGRPSWCGSESDGGGSDGARLVKKMSIMHKHAKRASQGSHLPFDSPSGSEDQSSRHPKRDSTKSHGSEKPLKESVHQPEDERRASTESSHSKDHAAPPREVTPQASGSDRDVAPDLTHVPSAASRERSGITRSDSLASTKRHSNKSDSAKDHVAEIPAEVKRSEGRKDTTSSSKGSEKAHEPAAPSRKSSLSGITRESSSGSVTKRPSGSGITVESKPVPLAHVPSTKSAAPLPEMPKPKAVSEMPKPKALSEMPKPKALSEMPQPKVKPAPLSAMPPARSPSKAGSASSAASSEKASQEDGEEDYDYDYDVEEGAEEEVAGEFDV